MMTKERLEVIINNVLDWGAEHEEEFRECLINAMGLTDEEIKELRLEDYISEDNEDYEDQFDSEIAIRICRANNIPLSDIEKNGSEAYWINDSINNLQDLYDINENYVIPTGDEDLIRDYREEILEEEE
jgi:hypothetical protein